MAPDEPHARRGELLGDGRAELAHRDRGARDAGIEVEDRGGDELGEVLEQLGPAARAHLLDGVAHRAVVDGVGERVALARRSR